MVERGTSYPTAIDGFPLRPEIWSRVREEMRLTGQQARIVELLLLGHKQKQIAPALGLAEPTLRTYLKRIYQREGVADHTELLLRILTISHRSETARPCPRKR